MKVYVRKFNAYEKFSQIAATINFFLPVNDVIVVEQFMGKFLVARQTKVQQKLNVRYSIQDFYVFAFQFNPEMKTLFTIIYEKKACSDEKEFRLFLDISLIFMIHLFICSYTTFSSFMPKLCIAYDQLLRYSPNANMPLRFSVFMRNFLYSSRRFNGKYFYANLPTETTELNLPLK